MKLSLAWICDHLEAQPNSLDIQTVVNRFNESVAEIESFHKVILEKKKFLLVEVVESTASGIQVSLRNGSRVSLPARTDLSIGQHAVITQEGNYRWIKLADVGSSKDGLLGSVEPSTYQASLDALSEHDWIIDIDNKSINHRPDLWSHRGVARELSVLFNVPLKTINALIKNQSIEELSNELAIKQTGAIIIQEPSLCSRFARVSIEKLNYTASNMSIALRLARIDAKPINAAVDLTNYVMFDIGNPMHAYNTTQSQIERFVIRPAQNKEKMTLLDGQSIELVPQDLVIADGNNQPIALAGVMGGQSFMVDKNTQSIVLEAAHFDPAAVRLSAARHKLRTDASTRFEKSLDPHNVTIALERYIALAEHTRLIPAQDYSIIARGKLPQQIVLTVTHALIQERIGAPIESSFIIKTLTALKFSVDARDGVYHIGVPSFRATKDIKIAEDIIEEVVRIYGFAKIPTQFQSRQMKPFPLHAPLIVRQIKRLLAFGNDMREIYNYSLYDTDFVKQLGLTDYTQQPHVLSPVSENWKYLVKSLVPGLLKYVSQAAPDHDELRFFESGRVWSSAATSITENKSLSGIIYKRHEQIDFYSCKATIDELGHSLGIAYEWKQMSEPTQPWYARYTSAQLLYNNRVVGTAGLVDAQFFARVAQGFAFVFELDLDFMIDFNKPMTQLKPISKYQKSTRDVSFLVAQKVTVQELLESISSVDDRIESMKVVDSFTKPEWKDKKSITLRMIISDHSKTLSKDEVEQIYNSVVTRLGSYEIQIR